MKKIVLSVATIAGMASLNTAKAQIRKYSNEFLSIGVGARALGMGNAQVGITNDPTAAYWNPAGLVNVKSDIGVGLMHAEYFAGIAKYDYGTVAVPVDATSVVGVTIIRFAVDDIPDTSELVDANGNINYDRIRSFSAADYGFIASYAKKHTKIAGLSYGANAKVIYRKVGEYATAWGFGLDLGLQYHTGNWRLGLAGRDITSTFNAWNFNVDKLRSVFEKTGNDIPQNGLELTLPKVIAGIGYNFQITEKINVLGELDLDFTFDGQRNVYLGSSTTSLDPHAGIEVGYDNFIFLRGGVNNIQKVKGPNGKLETTVQPNIGVGVRLGRINLDYAYTNLGSGSAAPYSNIFSLKVDIYKQKSATTTTAPKS